MSIQLWSQKGHHFFIDKTLDVHVGDAWQEEGQGSVQFVSHFQIGLSGGRTGLRQ
jgi:hypothetical protein